MGDGLTSSSDATYDQSRASMIQALQECLAQLHRIQQVADNLFAIAQRAPPGALQNRSSCHWQEAIQQLVVAQGEVDRMLSDSKVAFPDLADTVVKLKAGLGTI